MISKHLKYIDDNSDKFWNIKTNETDVIITYGKNGTAGTTLLKKFETVEIAEKEALKLISEKIKKGYSESGEVIIANKNNDNKTTEKIDTKKNLEDELKLLIFTKNVNGVQDFLDKSTKGNIIELRKLVKSQRKYWLDYVDLRKESVFKFGQNNWGYRADDKQREILLLFLVAVGDLKEINSQWDVYSAFQEILNNDRFRNLIRNSKPTWVEEFLLGKSGETIGP